MFQACINALTADQQQALHEALRAQPTNQPFAFTLDL